MHDEAEESFWDAEDIEYARNLVTHGFTVHSLGDLSTAPQLSVVQKEYTPLLTIPKFGQD